MFNLVVHNMSTFVSVTTAEPLPTVHTNYEHPVNYKEICKDCNYYTT